MSEEQNLSKVAKMPAKPRSMIDIVETAIKEATWDATQGPEHLRAGRFAPKPSVETAKSISGKS